MIKREKRLAKIISKIFAFTLWSPLVFLGLILKANLAPYQLKILLPAMIFFFGIIPLLAFRIRGITDWHPIGKKKKIAFLGLIIVGWLLVIFIARALGAYALFRLLIFCLTLIIIVCLITIYWRISLHMIGNTLAFLLLNLAFSWQVWWLFLFLPIIAWSRYRLSEHNILQLIAGFCLTVLVFCFFFH